MTRTDAILALLAPWILFCSGCLAFGIGGLWAELDNRRIARQFRERCAEEDRRADEAGRPRFPHNMLRYG
jgi:hypothetical protein